MSQFKQFALALLLAAAPTWALAQSYPSKPVQIVIGTAPGSPADVAARLLADDLSNTLGQRFVVENRPGANGNVAAELVTKAEPNGYTLFMCAASTVTINPHMTKIRWNPLKDFEPVAIMGTTPIAIGVPKNSPMNSLQDIIDTAKMNPGKLRYAAGTGSMAHFAGELLKSGAKIDITHVPFRGGGQMHAAVLAGDVDMVFDGVTPLVPHFQSGTMKPIAETGAKRLAGLPDLPAVAEAVPGYEATSWFAVFGPAGLDPAIVKTLNDAVNKMIARPDARAKLEQLGVDPEGGTPKELAARLARDYAKFGEVVQAAGIKME